MALGALKELSLVRRRVFTIRATWSESDLLVCLANLMVCIKSDRQSEESEMLYRDIRIFIGTSQKEKIEFF